MKKNLPKHDFSADRPIESRKQDLLGRKSFAESIATAIQGWHGDDSLVVALYGPWGSGKSSIKNMMIESCKMDFQDHSLIIIDFNPWEISGQDIITQNFFYEIENKLEKDLGKKGKELIKNIHKYSLKLMPVFSVITTTIPQLNLIQKLSFVVSSIVSSLSTLFSKPQSLSEVKQDLIKSLRKLDKNILIVIDDVDRLTSEEIRLLFRLIKANADFPQMIYLVLFQRDIIENCLQGDGIKGDEYLEKIVQVGFDIPVIEKDKVNHVLFSGLDKLFGSRKIDDVRWGNIFIPGLSPYFQTLRDVYRYLSTLSFHVGIFNKTGTFEVNDIDLIALEVLRVFEPEIYNRLPEFKSLLTLRIDYPYSDPTYNEEHNNKIESLVGSIEPERQPFIKIILMNLFPPIEWIFGGSHYDTVFNTQWLKELRICTPEIFDRYFQFSIPAYDISQTELNNFLSNTNNREKFFTAFKSFHERGLSKTILNRLDAYKENIDINHAVPFVASLFDIGELISDDRSDFFQIRSDWYILHIIHFYLKKLDDPTKRFTIIKNSMQLTDGIFMPLRFISDESNEQERQKNPNSFLLDENKLEELREICVGKIKTATGNGYLEFQPYLGYALFRWKEWTSIEEPKAWVEDLIKTDNGLLSFLCAFLTESYSQGIKDYVQRVIHKMSLNNIEEFVSIEILKERVEVLKSKSPKLTDKQKMAIDTFYKALKRRKEGKPEDGFWNDDD